MKNSENFLATVGTQTYRLLLSGLVLISSFGCDLDEVPEDDTTPPGFLFSISGPGGSYSLDHEDDFANLQLNIKAGGTYDFSLLGTDAGGVSNATFQLGTYEDFEIYNIEPEEVINEISGISRFLSLSGDRDDAITGLSLNGEMDVLFFDDTEMKSADFYFSVIDFNSNTTTHRLTVLLVTDDDQLGLIEL